MAKSINEMLSAIDNLPESFWEELAKKELEKEDKKIETFINNYTVGLEAVTYGPTNSWSSDDYAYSNVDVLKEISSIIEVICEIALDYCKSKRIDTFEEDEAFHTLRCYLRYLGNIYEIEEISGQGTFDRLSLLNDSELANIDNNKIVDAEGILKWLQTK